MVFGSVRFLHSRPPPWRQSASVRSGLSAWSHTYTESASLVEPWATAVHTPSVPQQLCGVLAEVTVVWRLWAGQTVWVAMNYNQRQRRKCNKDLMIYFSYILPKKCFWHIWSCTEYEGQKTLELRYEKGCQIETKMISMQDFQESLLMWNTASCSPSNWRCYKHHQTSPTNTCPCCNAS